MLTFKEDVKIKRSRGQARTQVTRAQLASGSPKGPLPSKALLREMKAFDPDIEFYFHPVIDRWMIYRVTHYGGSPADDSMIKVSHLQGPDGQFRPAGRWAIRELKSRELHRFSERSVKDAASVYSAKVMQKQLDLERNRKRDQNDMTSEFAKDISNCIREKNWVPT